MKCFYHSADLDGHCSGALIKQAYPDCVMIGINYGDKFPWDTIKEGETIYITDFSLQPFEDMIRLNRFADLKWIDHHKTAIQNYHDSLLLGGEEIDGLCNSAFAGCELTYMWLHEGGHCQVPLAVHLLGRYDVWDHKDSRVLDFQYAMRAIEDTWPDNTELWNRILRDDTEVERMLESGRRILDYQRLEYRKTARAQTFVTEVDGLVCLAANAPMVNSKLFDSLMDEDLYDAVIVFSFTGKLNWKVSLYTSKPGIDVSSVAVAHGGGGHAGAAGCNCPDVGWIMENARQLNRKQKGA